MLTLENAADPIDGGRGVGNIIGVGVDLLRVDRFARLVERHSQRFLSRILGPQERQEYHRRSARVALRYAANRFAAKEAFGKALGIGVRHPASFQSVQIMNNALGQPILQPSAGLADYLSQRAIRVSLSLSDEREYVVAFVVLERLAP